MNDAVLNLVVIRSADLERSVEFYSALGLSFQKEQHGQGPEHYVCAQNKTVFEIYPLLPGSSPSTGTRLGFRVPSVDRVLADLARRNFDVVSAPKALPKGRRIVVQDPDGHRVEITE